MSSNHQRYPQADAPFEVSSDDADGETLANRYQVLEELGSGSFGVVYKANETDTDEIVAIKHVRYDPWSMNADSKIRLISSHPKKTFPTSSPSSPSSLPALLAM